MIAGALVIGGLAVAGTVTVPVPVVLSSGVPATTELVVPCIDGEIVPGEGCAPSAPSSLMPVGSTLPVHRDGVLRAASGDLAPGLALLAAAPVWAALLAAGVVLVLLVPVLRATATGRPARLGSPHALGAAAVSVAVCWLLSAAGPRLAAPAVIDALVSAPLGGASQAVPLPEGWLVPALHHTWWPLLVAALLAALASAARRGERLAADSAGLV